jgi:hypothetical protein
MIRNPDMSEGQSRCTFRGEVEKFDDEKFLPVPVKKGTWQSVLLVEETGVSGENHRPSTSH